MRILSYLKQWFSNLFSEEYRIPDERIDWKEHRRRVKEMNDFDAEIQKVLRCEPSGSHPNP